VDWGNLSIADSESRSDRARREELEGVRIKAKKEHPTSNAESEKMKKQQKRPYVIIGATGNLRKDNF